MKHMRYSLLLTLGLAAMSLGLGLGLRAAGDHVEPAGMTSDRASTLGSKISTKDELSPTILEQNGRLERDGRLWILASRKPLALEKAQAMCTHLAEQEQRALSLPTRADVIQVLMADLALARVLERLDRPDLRRPFHTRDEETQQDELPVVCVSPLDQRIQPV